MSFKLLHQLAISCFAILVALPSIAQESLPFVVHWERALEEFRAKRFESAAKSADSALAAYDAEGFNIALERATVAFVQAKAWQRAEYPMRALSAAQAALSHQPALVSRYPEFNEIAGWALSKLGLFAQSSRHYRSSSDLAALFRKQGEKRFTEEHILSLKALAAVDRARSTSAMSEKAYVEPMRIAVRELETALGTPAYGLRFDFARALKAQGFLAESRDELIDIARNAPTKMKTAALTELAKTDFRSGDTLSARLFAREVKAAGDLTDLQSKLMAFIENGFEDLNPKEFLASVQESSAKTPGEAFLNSFFMLEAVVAKLEDAVASRDDLQSGIELVTEFLSALREPLLEDALVRDHVRAMKLSLARLYERKGSHGDAKKIFQQLVYNSSIKPALSAQAWAGLGRLGVDLEGSSNTKLDTRYELTQNAAGSAEFILSKISARDVRRRLRETKALSAILEQAVDQGFEHLLAQDVMLSPASGITLETPDLHPYTAKVFENAFRQIQLARQNRAALAISQTTARQAAGSGRLAGILRERDALLEARLRLQSAGAGFDVINSVDDKLDRLEATLDQEFPAFRAHLSMRPLTLEEVRALLAEDEVLVLYLQSEAYLHAFSVTSSTVHWHRSDLSAEQSKQSVKILRSALDPHGPKRAAAPLEDTGDANSFDTLEAHTLYMHVLGGLKPHLPQNAILLIVPDGALQSLPFGALVAKRASETTPYAKVHWAIRDHAFVTLPLTASLRVRSGAPSSETVSSGFVGLGDAEFSYDSEWLRLEPLPETEAELRAISEVTPGTTRQVILQNKATEEALMASAASQASVLAFATHGLMGNEADGLQESALALTPKRAGVKELSGADDGLLTTSEIAELDLSADWVLLSACNTARGPGGEGAEGLSGLARAFFYAGAQRLVVSHWAVQSDATVALTTGMFEKMGELDSTADGARALQSSMLKLINAPPNKAWSHPSVWAPFVVVGG